MHTRTLCPLVQAAGVAPHRRSPSLPHKPHNIYICAVRGCGLTLLLHTNSPAPLHTPPRTLSRPLSTHHHPSRRPPPGPLHTVFLPLHSKHHRPCRLPPFPPPPPPTPTHATSLGARCQVRSAISSAVEASEPAHGGVRLPSDYSPQPVQQPTANMPLSGLSDAGSEDAFEYGRTAYGAAAQPGAASGGAAAAHPGARAPVPPLVPVPRGFGAPAAEPTPMHAPPPHGAPPPPSQQPAASAAAPPSMFSLDDENVPSPSGTAPPQAAAAEGPQAAEGSATESGGRSSAPADNLL
eukprot:354306-Chlamydomonas_euryale.AAC.10